MTHFVIDETLDRGVLDAIVARDAAALAAIPRDRLRSGNSEILNWVAAAGALEGLDASVVDYVPGYRTPAGTGTGMAFARWD
jgi:OH-DDVA oxygenase/3-O-methylgallate 3,4-dioxygenase